MEVKSNFGSKWKLRSNFTKKPNHITNNPNKQDQLCHWDLTKSYIQVFSPSFLIQIEIPILKNKLTTWLIKLKIQT